MRTRTRTGMGTVKGGTGTKGKPYCRPSVGGAARIIYENIPFLLIFLICTVIVISTVLKRCML